MDSTSKCTTEAFDGFRRGIKLKTLTRSGVQPIFDIKDLLITDDIEVCAFRQEPADKSVRVFNGRLFPAMAGKTEERIHFEEFVDFPMEDVFKAVVVSDGLEQKVRNRSEDAAHGEERRSSGFIIDLSQPGEASGAFNSDFESGAARAHNEIGFPVPRLKSQVGFRRSFQDGNAAQDEAFGTVKAADASVRMMIREISDQMTGFGIDPLINRFMAKDRMSVFFSEQSHDDFGGPFQAEPRFDFLLESFSFEPFSAMALAHPGSSDKFRMEGMIMPPGEIAAELSRQRGMRPSQSPSNGPQRISALKEGGKNFPFFFVQMYVGVHRPPFYPMKPLHLVVH